MSAVAGKSKAEIIGDFRLSEQDTGSPEVQIALLTSRILSLTKHFSSNKDDKHSMSGMMKLISRRKKLLAYLKNTSPDRYKVILARLNLRK